MNKWRVVLVLCLAGSFNGMAWTAKEGEEKKGFFSKVKPAFILDSRQSFVLGRLVRLNGVRLGVSMGDHYRAGIASYSLSKPISLPMDQEQGSPVVDRQLNFEYGGLFFEYIIYRDFKWEVSLPITWGSGTATLDTLFTDETRSDPRIIDADMIAINAAAHYKLVPWLGLGVGTGYRQMMAGQRDVRRAFSAPMYVVKVKLFLGYLFKAIWKKEELEQEKEAYRNRKRNKEVSLEE